MIRCKTASACSRQHHICPQYRNPRVCQPLLHRLQHLRPGLKIMVTRHNCIYSKALRHFGVYMLSCPLPYLPVAQAHRYISLQIVTTIQKEDVVGMKGRPPPLQISTGICKGCTFFPGVMRGIEKTAVDIIQGVYLQNLSTALHMNFLFRIRNSKTMQSRISPDKGYMHTLQRPGGHNSTK